MTNKQIMIVEDDMLIASDLKFMLEDYGYRVLSIIDTGETAIPNAIELKPDLILMDIKLGGLINGIDAAYRIKKDISVPIIYVTAFADNDTYQNALCTNPFGYIIKPFNKLVLKSTIDFAFSKYAEQISISSNTYHDINKLKNEGYFINSGRNYFDLKNTSLSIKQYNSKLNLSFPKKTEPHYAEKEYFKKLLSKYDKSLVDLINDLKMETLAQKSLNTLVKIAYKLAIHKLKSNFRKVYNANKTWELKAEDMAIDSISSLFLINNKRKMLNLKISLLNWKEPIINDSDALYFLNKTVGMCVNQYLHKFLRDTNPAFARVLDLVNYTIKVKGYNKQDYFGTVYLTKNPDTKLICPVIGYDEFTGIPVSCKNSVNKIIDEVFSFIETNTDYPPAIPLNPLIERILLSSNSTFKYSETFKHSHLSNFCISDLIEKSLNKTLAKLDHTYSSKLENFELANLKSALEDVALDWKNGHPVSKTYEYLKIKFPALDKNQYEEKYKNIFEYLLKVFKLHVTKHLKQN